MHSGKFSSERVPTANEMDTIPAPELILLNEQNVFEGEADADSECAKTFGSMGVPISHSEFTPNSPHECGICKKR